MRILALVTDAHGGFGGISQYNRDALEAMCSFDTVDEVHVIPRLARGSLGCLPEKLRYDLSGLGGRANFAIAATRRAALSRPFDLVFCGHVNFTSLAAVTSRLTCAPMVLSLHGIEAWTPQRLVPAALLRRSTTKILSVSDITCQRFLSWSGINSSRIAIVPNTVRADFFRDRPRNEELATRLGLDGRIVILTLGRMASEERAKGFDEVLEVLSELVRDVPNIVYVAAGDGNDRKRLMEKAQRLGVAQLVVFPGQINDEEKADLYRLADAYVMPSRGEGFGIVMLEALAAGTPVVGSMLDGTREALRDGELGILVNPDVPTELRNGILHALRRPRSIPSGLDYFSFDRFCDRLRLALGAVSRI